MNELLTSKQVQDLLSIDRTTVYRMLKDGRLSGVKVGNQWRFHANQIYEMISLPEESPDQRALSMSELPMHCMQLIQNIFAQVVGVGAVTIQMNGDLLNEISNCSQFCSLVMKSETGNQACRASLRQLAKASDSNPAFFECHAGLQYKSYRIRLNQGENIAFVAGQFYSQPPDAEEQAARVRRLASTHKIDPKQLSDAVTDIPVLDAVKLSRLNSWLKEVTNTFTELCHERAEVIKRLKAIAEMSNLDFPTPIS